MLPGKQVSFFTVLLHSLIAGTLLLYLSSCVTPAKYPKTKPFVFKTNISVSGSFSPAEKQELVAKLQNQLDDSLKVRTISYAGVYKRVFRPPSFDTLNIVRSRIFMTSLLNSQGYFYPTIKDTFLIDTITSTQRRVTVNFQVAPGKQTKLDSIGFALTTKDLQELALKNRSESLLKKNGSYSISLISAEIDRLLQTFHYNGYYKVSRDDIYAEVDTVVAALIDPTLDPFEQVRLLDSLRRKSDKPTINVVFKQRPDADTNHLRQFYIGTVKVYPDQTLLQDSVMNYVFTRIGNIDIYRSSDRFKLPFIVRNVHLIPGARYNEKDYYRTVNTFNRLGAWQSVDVSLKERYDSVPFLDTEIKLFPALRRNLKIDLEASRNIADYLTTSQFFGLGVNLSLSNRNAYRESIQTSTNARYGVEFGSNFIQTLQTNLSHSIYFPNLILPFRLKKSTLENITNDRTVFNINGSYTIRRQIYDVASLNTSWGYEWTSRKINWQFVPLNIEYTNLNKKDSLDKLIANIPSLQYAFNDGFVVGMIGAMSTAWKKNNHYSNLKVRVEESGALLGLVKSIERNNLFRFVKTEVEYKHFINFKKSAWAFRAFAGHGFVYGFKGDQPERNLPFFKAYIAGGPYSMRAWQVRRLGPGSSILYDTTNNQSNDRFGNTQLEANIEYRFDLTTIAGIKVKSALFADIGNIWSTEYSDAAATQKIPEASFNLSRLGKDIAIGAGTSIRFDFDFFLIRFDWAYQIKNPRYSNIKGGWLYDIRLLNGQFQLGINYPF